MPQAIAKITTVRIAGAKLELRGRLKS